MPAQPQSAPNTTIHKNFMVLLLLMLDPSCRCRRGFSLFGIPRLVRLSVDATNRRAWTYRAACFRDPCFQILHSAPCARVVCLDCWVDPSDSIPRGECA